MNEFLNFLKRFIPKSIFEFFQPAYHRTLAFCAAMLYGFPGREMTIIGVTGTNGKSTTVEMLSELFSSAGYKTAALSSIRFKIGEEEIENTFKMTLPGRFFVQQFLARAKKAGVTHVILEVTSEGIKQFRHKHIDFAAAVMTNLTPEHIEAHRGFENYKKAKGELFVALNGKGYSVINCDDTNASYFLHFSAKKKIGYSLSSQDLKGADEVVSPARFEIGKNGISLYFNEGWEVKAPIPGKFNAENMLSAIAVVGAFGLSHEIIRQTFANFKGVPGRMEEIQSEPFRVIVDYAFTPNALKQVYQTLRGAEKNKLICVLGAAGGGRDKWKRPELGKIAGEFCSHVFITNEDPYDENQRSIMEDVGKGVALTDTPYEIIEDRRLAIRDALRKAKPGDIVIVTGKGSESAIATKGGKKIPWDDRAVVREELKRMN